MDASPEVERYTRIYFNIRIYTAPATLGLYAINGWFLGMQNARYPMIIAIVLNSLNILLDVMFVYGLDMHVDGVAWGTLIARYTGFGLAVTLLVTRYKDWLTTYVHKTLLELSAIREFFEVNRDIFIGATATAPMRNSMLIATLFIFLPAYAIGVRYFGNHAIWFALTLFMLARGLTLTFFAPKHIFGKIRALSYAE